MKLRALSRFTKISIAGMAALLLAWIALTLFAVGEKTKTDAIVKSPEDLTHCPHCGRPLPRAAIASGECPFCRLENGPEAAKIYRKGNVLTGRLIPYTLVGMFVVLLVANIVIAVRGRVKQERDETLYYYNCPKCNRRLRYRESQMGQLARCPLCHRPIVFPKFDLAKGGPLLRMRRWLHLTHS